MLGRPGSFNDFESNGIGSWIASGYTAKDIAEELGVSEKHLIFWRFQIRKAKHKKRIRRKDIEDMKLELVDFLDEI